MKKKVVIVGGGTAGMSILNHLHRKRKDLELTLIEPSEDHYYQPLWTLVGGGIFPLSKSQRKMKDFIPSAVKWIQDKVSLFEPEINTLTTDQGLKVQYDYLIVAPGIQIDWDKIEGLKETLGKNGVCSNYSKDTTEYTWEVMKNLRSGRALFTFPNTPIKCAGAPQKVMYLAEDWFRKNKVREQIDVQFVSAGAAIFGIKKYRESLEEIVQRRQIHTLFNKNLIKIDGSLKKAYFQDTQTGIVHDESFDMIHVTPPMSSPNFIKSSPLANEAGWVDVNKDTTQHNKYPNIFSLGDASSLPNSKTGAAIRKQGPVLVGHLLAQIDGKTSTLKYNGYASCPLVTSRNSCILAEFDYDGQPDETFPFDQGKERYSMYLLKKWVIPFMYWNAMMKGYF
jgi:sulfide:quinone oxidoreductase